MTGDVDFLEMEALYNRQKEERSHRHLRKGDLECFNDTWKAECDSCGDLTTVLLQKTTNIHYARTLCPNCEGFIGWWPKPDKNRRSSKHRKAQLRYRDIRCAMCGDRTKDKIRKGESGYWVQLHNHHIVSFSDGGEAVEGNFVTLCAECHLKAEGKKRRNVMDKYAPDLDEKDLEKTAQGGCPRCGSDLDKNSNVPRCPNCGVEPWSKGDRDGNDNTRSE